MSVEEIVDKKSFERWLKARPETARRQEATILAHRLAMRVFVLTVKDNHHSADDHASLILACARCIAVSRLAGTSPSRETVDAANVYAYDAAAAAAVNTAGATTTAAATAAAVNAANAAATNASANAATAAAHGAAASYAAAAAAIIWEDLSEDARQIESEKPLTDLLLSKIWHHGSPAWWLEAKDLMRTNWGGSTHIEFLFWPWFDWYDAVATGEPVFGLRNPKIRQELERDMALGSRNGKFNVAFWRRDWAAVNAEIASWVEEAKATDVLLTAQNVGPGHAWHVAGDVFQMVVHGDETDAEVARRPETAFEHDKLKERLTMLLASANEISTNNGWEGFATDCGSLRRAVNCPTDQLHTKIYEIYDCAMLMTTWLDFNNQLRANPLGNFERALEASHSRLLATLVATIQPWIGRFPSARRKDDEAGQAYRSMTAASLNAHTNLAQTAATRGVIRQETADLLLNELQRIEKLGPSNIPSQKIQATGAASIRKLVGAVLLVVFMGATDLTGEFVKDVAKKTKLWESSRTFLAEDIDAITDAIGELGGHERSSARVLLEHLKGEMPSPPPTVPDEPRLPLRKRRLSRRRR